MLLLRKVLISLCIIFAVTSTAVAASFEEGKEYQRLPAAITNNMLVKDLTKEANDKVQVLEFFSYGCNWCYKLDPIVSKWSKTLPQDVAFQRVPVEFQPSWRNLTKAYYVAVDLKALDKVHDSFFEAVQSERITNTDKATLRQFFAARGIKPEDFDQGFDSFDVNRKQKWANAISRAYRITAVPTLLVQGPKGSFTSTVSMAGGEDNLIKVTNYLIQMQRETKKS
ncbi:MAG: thiol:disulfide interchange protein DsbA/DsbL [Candidatus Berkiellales bacterium]